MDQARKQESDEVLDLGVAIDAAAEGSLGEGTSIRGDETSKEVDKDPGLSKELKDGPEEAVDEDMRDQKKTNDTFHGVDHGTSYNSGNLVSEAVPETVVVIDSAETGHVNRDNRKLEVKVNESGLSKVTMRAPKGASEADKNSCVIDIKCSSRQEYSENLEGERICRICHLAAGQPSDATAASTNSSATTGDLIQLGCACKDELGIAHSHCAEAWFKLKGNRLCEICGETAKNVSGVTDAGFMEEWNERRFIDSSNTSSGICGGCWRGQPFCNFLMACLVIAFVLPWFFRVNMF
ncbi:uncharacterized protein G2W53_042402 [Senna tora]|uniref:RING-CH-type domain-containing protein n=1 Tax=Senna tora TaxID=362788 RepID=A0A834SH61_9FABA|nr:uncharacterized protein G2W53_042402 [Senna tora]